MFNQHKRGSAALRSPITNKAIHYLSVLCLTLWGALACTAIADSDAVEVVAEYELSQELNETSGLYCSDKGYFTINDSGNAPVIYQINEQGSVTHQTELPVLNRDWEAITGDNKYLYVGDFGNNRGKRKWLQIYKVAYKTPENTAKIVFTYEENVIADNVMYEHDYDAEALVAREDKLILFSKSWQSKVLKIYQLDKNEKRQYLAEPVGQVNGIPGVITGADWDSANQQYVLVGYDTGFLGIANPFIAILSDTYKLQQIVTLAGYGQVEGLCVTGDNTVWVTQEGSSLAAARLIKLKLLKTGADSASINN